MKNMSRLVLFALAILITLPVLGQRRYKYSYFRVEAGTGITSYLGDLDDNFTLKFTRLAFSVGASYRFNPFISMRMKLFQGWAGAADSVSNNEPRNRRNLSFRTRITELSMVAVFDFIPTERSYYRRPPFVPYIFGGVALFNFNPQAQLRGQWIDLQPLGTEGQYLPDQPGRTYPKPYALTQIALPVGVGVRLAITRRLDLEVEMGFRKTFTDYIDDVSGLYPDLDALRAQNPTAAILSDRIDRTQYPEGAAAVNGIRGSNTQTDWYVYTGAKLCYILDWVRCPQFR